MSDEAREVSRAVKDAGRWITESLDEIGGGMWGGSGIEELVGALNRIGDAGARIAAALESIAAVMEEGRDEG